MKRTYPYTAWVLTPAFLVKEVTLCEKAFGGDDWDRTAAGKPYHVKDLHPSRSTAISAGRQQIIKQADDLKKKRENLAKKASNLDKAEGI
ncbi:MAG TPA: hypothetical protein VM783_05610 [Candidatus Acidoferrum sp.]|nr:hypothetical protein [Candidatus Acidoferrum sp.]